MGVGEGGRGVTVFLGAIVADGIADAGIKGVLSPHAEIKTRTTMAKITEYKIFLGTILARLYTPYAAK